MKGFLFIVFLVFSAPAICQLDETTCSNLVVTELKIANPNLSGAAETQAKTYWAAICKGLINHIKTAGQINLSAGDIVVPGLGLLDSVSGPVTGSAQNSATILSGKIQ